ncbi:MAG: hypothetical protein AAB533_02955 [Patescibacteria group bacterium]
MSDFLSSQRSSVLTRFGAGRGVSLFFPVAVVACAAVVAAIGGLLALNRVREAEREEFVAQNTIKEESVRPELLAQISLLDRRLKGVRGLLDEHTLTSNIFRMIEADTHPQVRFLNFIFSADGLKIDMTGEAANYRALSQQIGIFERDPQIEKTEFGGLSATSEGLVGFKLSLTVKQALLHLRQ